MTWFCANDCGHTFPRQVDKGTVCLTCTALAEAEQHWRDAEDERAENAALTAELRQLRSELFDIRLELQDAQVAISNLEPEVQACRRERDKARKLVRDLWDEVRRLRDGRALAEQCTTSELQALARQELKRAKRDEADWALLDELWRRDVAQSISTDRSSDPESID